MFLIVARDELNLKSVCAEFMTLEIESHEGENDLKFNLTNNNEISNYNAQSL